MVGGKRGGKEAEKTLKNLPHKQFSFNDKVITKVI